MMLNVTEERKTSVLKVMTDLSEHKSDGGPSRSLKEVIDSPPSFEELRSEQQTKRLLQKKNQLHPLFANHPYRCASMYGPRATSSRPKLKDVSQRIVSAKLLQIKELRNQLTLTQHQLNEITNENRFLKTLQKRQEVALRKYEGHEARLPQLIQSHNEEVRILTSKFKQLKHTNQRLVEKLKAAEQQLSSLQEQHLHLVGLSRDQQLGERETLATQVEELQQTVRDQNNTIQLLTRKVDLERKNYKHELGTEKNKRTEVERKLSLAMQTIENLKDQIEAKEKCLSAIVPSRYVRIGQGLSQTSLQTSRMSHSQLPRTPLNQNGVSVYKNNVIQTSDLSSTEQMANDTDVLESQNGNNTSDSGKNINGTILPKIKPQITNRNLRNQYKLSSKRLSSNKLSSNKKSEIKNETPDYSSSFTSDDIPLKDLAKNSDRESEKVIQAKREFVLNSQRDSGRGRKFSVDSGVINRSESGKITQRTDQSRASSTKTRRNSISVCPTDLTSSEEIDKYLQQDNLAAKIETHKSIREELRELEEKLLQGSSFLEKSRKKKSDNSHLEEAVKEMSKGMIGTPGKGSDEDSEGETQENLDISWNDIHNKIKAESDAAEAKLEEYYSALEKNELNIGETEDYIALEEEQKERLLKALKDIDKEAQGVSSASSSDESKLSSSRKPTRRKSDGYSYNFSKNIDNLHRGLPVYDKVKIPVVEKMRREEKEYLSELESGRKNKADFMKDLFGNFDNVGLQTDAFPSSERRSEDIERLVQLNRPFD
uniref:Lebercilin domain-containing protein n=1 Tax=Graphocephala atropunctata TaxID=36148 RepID=A0A1B6LGR4_9HEMI